MSGTSAGDMTGGALADARRRGNPAFALLLALLLAIAAGGFAWAFRGIMPIWALFLGALLAFGGLISAFAWLAGALHFGSEPQQRLFFDGLLDAMNEPCVVADARGRAIYSNGAYLKLASDAGLGRLVGVEHLYTGYPDIAEKVYRLSQAARDQLGASEELRLQPGTSAAGAKPDLPVWLRLSVSPMPGSAGKGYSLWRLTDISADRAKQEAAFANLQYIIGYLDDAPAGFFSAERDGRIAYINATLAGWLGIDIGGSANGGLNAAAFLPEQSVRILDAIAAEPGRSRIETHDIDLIARDGHPVPVRIFHRTDFDEHGARMPSRSVVIRKSAASEPGSDLKLARFFNNAPIGIAEIDSTGVIRNMNEAFLSLSSEARRGAPLAAMILEAQRPALAQVLKAAREGEAVVHHADVSIPGEVPRTVQIAASRLTEADDGFVVYALDTTENKTLEVQLAQSQKMQAIGQLAGGVAHDFNNVLTAIIGFSDLLLARHKPTDPAFADIMNIKQNANRAANLVRQLLAFSRRQTLRPEVLSLTDALSDLGNLLGRLLGEKISLKTAHGRDLWTVKVDINQFEQVIINLAVNARDAMPKGGTLTVRTHNMGEEESKLVNPGLMPPGEYVVCEIEDTGTGIPKEIRDKIWEPFFSTKDVGKGTGLGLSTVYGIVKQTGGFIFLDSEIGRGTVFRIYLPRHKQTTAELEDVKEEKKEIKRTDTTGKGTILLVEDEDAVRAFASRALESRGYTVLQANSGERALEVIEEHGEEFDLILSDVVMPEMDGPTLLKELRKMGIMTKVIFISGYAEDAFEKNLEGHVDFAFLPKPFSLKQLAEAVKDAMDG